jgi:hypothetical protein
VNSDTTVTSPHAKEESSSSLESGALLGTVIGIALVLVTIVVSYFVIQHRKKRKHYIHPMNKKNEPQPIIGRSDDTTSANTSTPPYSPMSGQPSNGSFLVMEGETISIFAPRRRMESFDDSLISDINNYDDYQITNNITTTKSYDGAR